MLASISSGAGLLGGVVGLFVVIFLVILAVLWFVLPFAVFGIKGRLDTLIALQRHQNHQMVLLHDELESYRSKIDRVSRPPTA